MEYREWDTYVLNYVELYYVIYGNLINWDYLKKYKAYQNEI